MARALRRGRAPRAGHLRAGRGRGRRRRRVPRAASCRGEDPPTALRRRKALGHLARAPVRRRGTPRRRRPPRDPLGRGRVLVERRRRRRAESRRGRFARGRRVFPGRRPRAGFAVPGLLRGPRRRRGARVRRGVDGARRRRRRRRRRPAHAEPTLRAAPPRARRRAAGVVPSDVALRGLPALPSAAPVPTGTHADGLAPVARGARLRKGRGLEGSSRRAWKRLDGDARPVLQQGPGAGLYFVDPPRVMETAIVVG
mmetsp:Transcript_21382/g.67136  ORF Transcript_21382/g.67136 Transcript_21382/m.67136 type:complete len:255 (-) Transcript_21382:71-835(-)